MEYFAVSPSEQSSAMRGKESAPCGNQMLFRQIDVSKNRNLDPSARNAAISAGNMMAGQMKKAGKGVNTKNHAMIVDNMPPPAAT
jgi:hypothetical protein